jgi:hypothetical protein
MREYIKEAFKTCLLNSTLHALPNVCRSENKTGKIIWILLFLVSCSFCFVLVVLSFLEYLSYDVNTKIRINAVSELEFPVVTLCNMGVFTTEYGLNHSQKIFEKNYQTNNKSNRSFNFDSYMNELDFGLYLRLSVYEFDSDNERRKLGLSINELIKICSFGFTECKKYEFVYLYDTRYGNCFKFNSGFDEDGNKLPTRISKRSNSGLRLLLYATDLNDSSLFFSNGFYIDIGFQKNRIRLDRGVRIKPSKKSFVFMKKTRTTQISKPYSNCTGDLDNSYSFDRKIYNIMISKNIEYSHIDCWNILYQLEVSENCACYDRSFITLSNMFMTCTNSTELKCMDIIFTKYNVQIDQMREKLNAYCPIACESVKLEFDIEEEEMPLGYIQHFKRTYFKNTSQTVEHLKKNLAFVDIAYRQMEEVQIEETISMTLLDLISNCGGMI